MHWEYTPANKKLLKEAQEFLPLKYQSELKSPAQLISRMLLSKMAEEKCNTKNFLALSDANGRPQKTNGLYWSVSYKIKNNETHIAVALAQKPVGIDIEIIEPRSEELLNLFSESEYEPLGGKNWQNFFILWTAKEALIKKLSLTLNDMQDIKYITSQPTPKQGFGVGAKQQVEKIIISITT